METVYKIRLAQWAKYWQKENMKQDETVQRWTQLSHTISGSRKLVSLEESEMNNSLSLINSESNQNRCRKRRDNAEVILRLTQVSSRSDVLRENLKCFLYQGFGWHHRLQNNKKTNKKDTKDCGTELSTVDKQHLAKTNESLSMRISSHSVVASRVNKRKDIKWEDATKTHLFCFLCIGNDTNTQN